MQIISNRTGDIQYHMEPGLLEWLQQRYPYSKYHVIEIS